jgi:hypothetical protein
MRIAIAAVFAFVFASSLLALEVPKEEVFVSMKTAIMSKYLDRSVVRNEDPVMTSDVRLEYKKWGLELRTAFDTTDYNDNSGEMTDVEIQLDYNVDYKTVDFQFGYLGHAYPAGDKQKGTSELFVKASKDMAYNLTPYIMAAYDIDEVDGVYGETGVNHKHDLTDKIPQRLSRVKSAKLLSHANVGYGSAKYNDYYFDAKDNGFQDAKVGTGLEMGFGKTGSVTLTPSAEYYYMLDSGLNSATDEDTCGMIYGLTLGCKF